MRPIEPCKVCGSTDVKLYDCGYSSFNCWGASCNLCGNELKYSGDPKGDWKSELSEDWFRSNNLGYVMADIDQEIKNLNQKKSHYRNLNRNRNNKIHYNIQIDSITKESEKSILTLLGTILRDSILEISSKLLNLPYRLPFDYSESELYLMRKKLDSISGVKWSSYVNK